MKKLLWFMIVCLAAGTKVCAAATVVISGNLAFLRNVDSVRVTEYRYFGFASVSAFNRKFAAKVVGDSFRIEMPAPSIPTNIFIDFSRLDKNINYLMIEPGDRIVISEKQGAYFFEGTNAEKYNMLAGLNTIYGKYHRAVDESDPRLAAYLYRAADSTAIEQLAYLEGFRSVLQPVVYRMIRGDIVAELLFKGAAIAYAGPAKNLAATQTALAGYHQVPALAQQLADLCNDTSVIYSHYFLRGEVAAFRTDSCFFKGKEFDAARCYQYFKRRFSGKVREALVTWLIYNRKDQAVQLSGLIADALTFVKNIDFRQLLLRIDQSRLPGAVAADFRLTDEKGEMRTFSEFSGKVVLLDFWYTGCPSCAATAPYLADVEARFKGRPVVFISICTDKDRATWLSSVGKRIYTCEYAINLYTNGNGMDDPVIGHYGVTAFPTLILVGKDGRLLENVGDPRTDSGRRLARLIRDAL